MPAPKLEVLPDLCDEDGVPAFALRTWDREEKSYVWVNVPITDDELKKQLREPLRLSHDEVLALSEPPRASGGH